MSPLARSLLTIATLLATAYAKTSCTNALFGVGTGDAITFEAASYPSGGGRVTVENACQTRQGRMLAGELVTACNYDDSSAGPDVEEAAPPTFSPFDVVCRDGCLGGGSVLVVQYCY